MKKKIAYGVTGLILGCIFLFPIYILIMNSFKTTKGIFTDVLGFPAKGTFTLENYKNAFQELDYIRSFMNSLLITVGKPHTAHTTNPVPFILVNADPSYKLREGGCLADIAPTLLEIMGLPQPKEMTGKSLIVK